MGKPSVSPAVIPAEVPAAQQQFLQRYRSWRRFHYGPRQRPEPLLGALSAYPDCVLVAGCQRSGTTMLTRIIAGSRAFRPLRLTADDELDAALALAGYVDLPAGTRYCFQTTYLNERYRDYSHLGAGQRLIWVLRNPYSVVHSMVYNWKGFALKELYHACGTEEARQSTGPRRLPWRWWPARIEMACQAYSGKTRQVLEIRRLVPPAQLLVVDYDQLVRAPREWLPGIFEFIGEPYDDSYASGIRADSLKKADRLTTAQRQRIAEVAEPAWRECLTLVRQPEGARAARRA